MFQKFSEQSKIFIFSSYFHCLCICWFYFSNTCAQHFILDLFNFGLKNLSCTSFEHVITLSFNFRIIKNQLLIFFKTLKTILSKLELANANQIPKWWMFTIKMVSSRTYQLQLRSSITAIYWSSKRKIKILFTHTLITSKIHSN